jgi:cytochrome c peroxidase
MLTENHCHKNKRSLPSGATVYRNRVTLILKRIITMRKSDVVLLLFISTCIQIHWCTFSSPYDANEPVRKWILEELKETQQALATSLLHLDDRAALKQIYHQSRQHYKHIEFFVEYCSPREAKNFINGPLVPKGDLELSNEVIPPQGFQRIEELLFSKDSLDTHSLENEYTLLRSKLAEINNYYESIEITEGQLLEMCQLQFFRIAAMNLSGYDGTISQTNVTESFWCIQGIEEVLKKFKPHTEEIPALKNIYRRLLTNLNLSENYLQAHPDYNKFDRLKFIINYITPLNNACVTFHQCSKLPWTKRIQAIDLQNGFLFGKESLNRQYFSMYYNDTINIQLQAQLGKILFFDPLLSGNNKSSCASCHNPEKAFTDGVSKGLNFDKTGTLPRNTPTLLNVIYQKAFFDDGRAYQLEQQVFDVVHNKTEMQSRFEDVVNKLEKSSDYKQLFEAAFKGTTDTVITSYAIQKAIMEYEKTLVSMNSRFDQYLHGDKKKLTAQEINGYNLFAGKALCGSCHFFPLFNGTVPPFYNDSEYEVIGTPADSNNRQLDEDKGRYTITNLNEQLHAFKTPTIRNIALTAPYMHNGIYTKLEQVIDFYHKGGGAGLKLSVPNQTLPFDSLQLAPQEKADIVAFLKTLTDTIGLTSRPVVPAFPHHFY